MTDNRLPPGYIPLTHHQLNGNQNSRSDSRGRGDNGGNGEGRRGERQGRNGGNGGRRRPGRDAKGGPSGRGDRGPRHGRRDGRSREYSNERPRAEEIDGDEEEMLEEE